MSENKEVCEGCGQTFDSKDELPEHLEFGSIECIDAYKKKSQFECKHENAYGGTWDDEDGGHDWMFCPDCGLSERT